MKAPEHYMRIIGRREFVDFPELQIGSVEAKIDTGAYTSSIHCEDIELVTENEKQVLAFTLLTEKGKKLSFRYADFSTKNIRNSFGEMEERFIIRTVIHIGHKRIRAGISLSKRDRMKYPVLIGRKAIKGKFLVDVKELHLGGLKINAALQKQIIK